MFGIRTVRSLEEAVDQVLQVELVLDRLGAEIGGVHVRCRVAIPATGGR